MRRRFVVLCWLAALVLLAWPVRLSVLGADLASCGPAGWAFASGLTPPGSLLDELVGEACAGESYPYVASAAGVALGGTLLASLGWRDRRRKRRTAKAHARLERKAAETAKARVEAQRRASARSLS